MKKKVTDDIYLIGDSEITDSRDCAVYLLDLGELVLIDTGAGLSVDKLIRNIEGLGLNPKRITN
ncbi:MAG TPA: hypothetical protein PLX88_08790, partial [Syntrophorhabdaceae bacterium]|nr:hypothetical protein [Syntrophorhabdaceae bacterium]